MREPRNDSRNPRKCAPVVCKPGEVSRHCGRLGVFGIVSTLHAPSHEACPVFPIGDPRLEGMRFDRVRLRGFYFVDRKR